MDAVDRLLEAEEALPDDLTSDEVLALFAVQDRLTARLSAALERVDPAAEGAVTMAHWLRTRAGRSTTEAAALVRRAARLGQCPDVAAAWLDGRLATGQVDAVVAHISDRTQPIFTEHEPTLVPAFVGLSTRDTEAAMRRWSSYANAVVESPCREPAERTLQLSRTFDGWTDLSGQLDPSGAMVVDAALNAVTVPDGEGEPARSRGQRRADALVSLCRHFLDHAQDAATSRRRRPDVTVVLTLDDLEQQVGRSLDGEVLDARSLSSLLCDAGVHRLLTDGHSVIIDAGRTTRAVGHHLFGALAVRDGGCRFPACDRPVSWCEAHHVVPWQHGGSTDPSNLVLLCWRHHHDFAHHPKWHLKLLPDATVTVTRPDGITFTSRPPPPDVTGSFPGTEMPRTRREVAPGRS